MKKLRKKIEKITNEAEYHVIIFLLPFLHMFISYYSVRIFNVEIIDYYKLIQIIMVLLFVAINYKLDSNFIRILMLSFMYNTFSLLIRSNFLTDYNLLILKDYLVYLTYPLFFYYLYFLQIKNDQNIFSKLLKCFFYVTLILSFLNVLMNINNVSLIWKVNNSYQINFKSIFPNRNQFAQLLLITIILIDNSIIFSKKTKKATLLFLIMNLIFTFSRTSNVLMISYFIFKYFIIPLTYKYKKTIVWTICFLALTIVILLMLVLSKGSFLLSKLIRFENGLTGRTQLWKLGWKVFIEHWILGMGLSQSRSMILYYGIQNTQYHNMYLETLAAYGIVGTSISIYLVTRLLINIDTLTPPTKKLKKYYSFIIILIYGLFESASFFKLGLSSSIISYFVFIYPIQSFEIIRT